MADVRSQKMKPLLLPASLKRRFIWTLLFWSTVALIFSAFGYFSAMRRGAEQLWWPTFGYSLAIFSVWAVMTWPVLWLADRVEKRVPKWWMRLTMYAFGLPLICAFHVFTFAVLYWPFYNDGGRIATRWAMGERMLLANLDTNALFYALLIGAVALLARRREADTPATVDDAPRQATDDALVIRSRGGLARVPIDMIDRIEAAGGYCEIHAGGAVHLMDETLSSLGERLPAHRFARVHRSTIVALDRVANVKGVGHGDAIIALATGAEIRLSRRYREEFEQRLGLG